MPLEFIYWQGYPCNICSNWSTCNVFRNLCESKWTMFRTRHKKSVLVFWALITAVGSLSFLQTLVWSIYKGLCETGAWGCFYELSCISVDMFSVAAVYVKTLQDGIWPRNKGRWGIVIFRLTFVLSYGTITFFWFLGETTELKMADFHSNKSRKKEMFQKKTKALFWWVYKKIFFSPFFWIIALGL